MKQKMKASEHLSKARDLILNPDNWGQREFKSEDGKLCATGALLTVDGGVDNHVSVETPAYRILGEVMQSPDAICNFNDTHTHAEVIAKFDEAIALAISRGD